MVTTTTTANDKFTVMLGYTEIVGVLIFSYLERLYCTNEGGLTRVAPLRSYPLLTACLFASSALSNLSLSYINFPTKVGKFEYVAVAVAVGIVFALRLNL